MSSRVNMKTLATIKFCVKLGMTPALAYGKMTAANINYKVSRRLIFKWHKCFPDDRESLEDDSRSDRPVNMK